jgi:XRE family transcriptional regulator of biofilm formation
MELENIGERIKKLRITKGWTMQELAEKTNSTAATINNIEKGKSANPTARLVVELASVFGVSTDFLLMGKEDFVSSDMLMRLDDREKAFIKEYVEFCMSKKTSKENTPDI